MKTCQNSNSHNHINKLTPSDENGLERLIADSAAAYVQRQLIENDALLRFAADELGAIITPVGKDKERESAAPVDQCPQSDIAGNVELERRVLNDRELGRGAVVRGEERQYRVWCYGQNLIRSAYPSGLIPKTAFFEHLQALGVTKSSRSFNDVLQHGRKLYWKLRWIKDTDGVPVEYVELRSWKKLATRMLKKEQAKAPYVVAVEAPGQTPIIMRTFDTNQPGTSRVWLDLSGSIGDVRAALYKSWLMGRADNKMQRVQLSRRLLHALWHTPRKTIIQWEKRAGIKPDEVYAEHHDPNADLVPSYAFLCQSKDGDEFASWRSSNWFNYQSVDNHPHGGQRRKVRKAVDAIMSTSEPTSLANGGQKRGQRIGRRIHFVSITSKNDFIPAHKRIKHHLRKHQVNEAPHRHYALLGVRYGVHIEEYSLGASYRKINQWRSSQAESTGEFIERASNYRRGWVDRWC